ncbi:MAG: NAD-glutamate dehydrogenase [Pseudomonadota bacterium]
MPNLSTTAHDKAVTVTADLIDRILVESEAVIPRDQRDRIGSFVSQYYNGVPTGDLQGSTPANLAGAALAHWAAAEKRKPGDAQLRVYNPHVERHGWQSPHTIVELVTDDRPFLVDSLQHALARSGATVHLTVHPILAVVRDEAGRLEHLADGDQKATHHEAWVQIQVDKRTDTETLRALEINLRGVLTDVTAATDDWQAMLERAELCVAELGARKNDPAAAEGSAFMQWLRDGHFTFLGYCEYAVSGKQLKLSKKASLGAIHNRRGSDAQAAQDVLPQADVLIDDESPLLVTKSALHATVHRDARMDLIAVSVRNDAGEIRAWRCFLGLFTSHAYRALVTDIPLLRRRANTAMQTSQLNPEGHDGKQFADIIETFPRDMFLQTKAPELTSMVTGILHLQERQRVALFGQRDRFGRFYNCLVYVPRDKYGRELRLAVQAILRDALDGCDVEFDTEFSSGSALARLNYVIWTRNNALEHDIDWAALEQKLIDVARSWEDQFADSLHDHYGEERGNVLFALYGGGFDAAYKDAFQASASVFDVERMESIAESGDLALQFFRPLLADENVVHFKLYSPNASVELSDVLPVLENMGLRVIGEHPFIVERSDDTTFHLHEFTLRARDGQHIDPDAVSEQFAETFARVWRGEVENDSLNQLVVQAGLSWRDVVVLRALSKYMQQIRSPFSQHYIATSLHSNTAIVRNIVALFHARFDPAQAAESADAVARIDAEIDAQLEHVASLDEDRILRTFRNLVGATLRTNHFQRDAAGQHKDYLSIKLDPAQIEGIPLPRPMFEIFVCSPRVEGVHLRGGKVARGGLRWSDRREDFRTEILGLVKAQMVKNAVIVPVGSKGGFVLKQAPAPGDREAFMAEGVACYKTFLRGLLDLTDNLVAGDIVPPTDVVRYDPDDPYLVVAADKGTATFSDFANSVSKEYGFWLGDAFASGGSNGYDHKGMGITARGAWESVKRHFREIGVDTQSEDFTVVGVGDMGGDVFGNGMLLSEHIRLVAAFNHMHIFIDPSPDAASSFSERKRLFETPRTTWEDYNTDLISEGGGVYARSAKSITLSKQACNALGLDKATLTPNELINGILKAPVDLFWNGGIGTYIKASSETHADAADRANDAVRVDATELRCRVIGEGGNLGVTQEGRIEFARRHGVGETTALNYTDAIDNSAGVDCSDHEVNIKILLDQVVEQGELTEKQRDKTLEVMTDEVGLLVLKDNYQQTQCITLAAAQAATLMSEHGRFMSNLEAAGQLNRALEFLPDKEQIAERLAANEGLSRPELAVLVSYAKMTLYTEVLESNVPDDPFLMQVLVDYFPALLAERYRDQMADHRLRREIIATVLTNAFVNRLGPSFAFRLHSEIGAEVADLMRAFVVTVKLFDMDGMWGEIEALDNTARASESNAQPDPARGS